ncbi:MAG TPA: 3D domain-containing protein [Desulfosporosinus sp.]
MNPIFLSNMVVIPLITIILVLLPGQARATELNEYQKGSIPVAAIKYTPISDIPSPLRPASAPLVAITRQVSRGEPAQKIESRMMRVTAYTGCDKGMNGKNVTANGEKALEGQTLAADPSIPFGTQIYIPALGKTFTVTDRGGAITGNRLDMYMDSQIDALEFGNRELEVRIKYLG